MLLNKILIVEDEDRWSQQYIDALVSLASCDVATNLEQIQHFFKKGKCKLILLDISLDQPFFNSVCRQAVTFLRQKCPEIPIVAITGKQLSLQELSELYQLGEGGIVDFFHKSTLYVPDFSKRIQLAIEKHPIRIGTEPTLKQFKYDVFVSYSHKDSTWVKETLLIKLDESDIRVCIDFYDFRPGYTSVSEMERAVLQSQKTLLVMTPNYFRSSWTEYEFVMALTLSTNQKAKRVVPLLLKKCDLPLSIQGLVYLDFSDSKINEIQWQKLIAMLSMNS